MFKEQGMYHCMRPHYKPTTYITISSHLYFTIPYIDKNLDHTCQTNQKECILMECTHTGSEGLNIYELLHDAEFMHMQCVGFV